PSFSIARASVKAAASLESEQKSSSCISWNRSAISSSPEARWLWTGSAGTASTGALGGGGAPASTGEAKGSRISPRGRNEGLVCSTGGGGGLGGTGAA